MFSTRKKIALSVSALACAYLLVAVYAAAYEHWALVPKLEETRAQFKRFEPRILADLKLLSEHPVFEDKARTKNVERFLTGFIEWSGVGAPKSIDHDRLVDVMTQHREATKSADNWNELLQDEALSDLDLAWVDQLTAYDYFDIETHPAFTDAISRVPHSHGVVRVDIVANLPIPNYEELRFAVTARAAQLALENHKLEAIQLFHHVSYLVWTSDTLIGSMSAVSMLKQEKALAEYLDVDWTTPDDSRTQALRRTSWAWIGINRFADDLAQFEPYLKRQTGACGGMTDLTPAETLIKDYLRPKAPGESDQNEWLNTQEMRIKKFADACGHPQMMAFTTPIRSPKMISRVAPNPARIPFLRRIVGLTLSTLARPNYFGQYEENPRQPASK